MIWKEEGKRGQKRDIAFYTEYQFIFKKIDDNNKSKSKSKSNQSTLCYIIYYCIVLPGNLHEVVCKKCTVLYRCSYFTQYLVLVLVGYCCVCIGSCLLLVFLWIYAVQYPVFSLSLSLSLSTDKKQYFHKTRCLISFYYMYVMVGPELEIIIKQFCLFVFVKKWYSRKYRKRVILKCSLGAFYHLLLVVSISYSFHCFCAVVRSTSRQTSVAREHAKFLYIIKI